MMPGRFAGEIRNPVRLFWELLFAANGGDMPGPGWSARVKAMTPLLRSCAADQPVWGRETPLTPRLQRRMRRVGREEGNCPQRVPASAHWFGLPAALEGPLFGDALRARLFQFCRTYWKPWQQHRRLVFEDPPPRVRRLPAQVPVQVPVLPVPQPPLPPVVELGREQPRVEEEEEEEGDAGIDVGANVEAEEPS